MQVMTPFRNGFSQGKAGDFLFLASGPRQIDLDAFSAGDAIRGAWEERLRKERTT